MRLCISYGVYSDIVGVCFYDSEYIYVDIMLNPLRRYCAFRNDFTLFLLEDGESLSVGCRFAFRH